MKSIEILPENVTNWHRKGVYEVLNVQKESDESVKIAFSGSRERSANGEIRKILRNYNPETDIIVHGGCPKGIDSEVDKIARSMSFEVEVYYPDGNKNKDFLKRNERMAKSDTKWLHALPLFDLRALDALTNKTTRGGTEHTIRQFISNGKKVYVHLNICRIVTREFQGNYLSDFL